ncbi:MAG: pyrroline-5-carboxylate reductase [Deltaproteobacteria bacterium]|nr:pyrroline-5-carboxylate reductase [Deltaproteobacteria bacterium]
MAAEPKIGFIGGGNMAEAIIKGLLGGPSGLRPALLVSEPAAARRDHLVATYALRCCAGNGELAAVSDIIILAVKPQTAPAVLNEIGAAVGGEKLLISIMAGISTATLEGYFPRPVRLVRAMPNTPALVGEGVTAICAGAQARSGDLETAAALLATIGPVHRVQEGQMDTVTGLSGSGPAYVFTLIEALADGGVLGGLPRQTALDLAVQTVLGSAALVKATGEHPALLRDKVCSPGGTTIAGMKALEENGFRNAVLEAVSRAARRAGELGAK